MSEPDPELTPDQEARVRRLLAEARHDEPIPADLVARLDRVIAGLADAPADAPAAPGPRPTGWSPPPPDDLEAARRRRRVRRGGLLLAAAAVVAVAGVGIGGLVGSRGGEEASSDRDSATGSFDRPAADDGGDSAGDSGTEFSPHRATPTSPPSATSAVPSAPTEVDPNSFAGVPRAPYRLSRDTFVATVQRLRTAPGLSVGTDDLVAGDELSRSPAFLCTPSLWGPGLLLPAAYDGVPSVLVYRPPEGATQTVDLLRCGTREVLRSTVIPAD